MHHPRISWSACNSNIFRRSYYSLATGILILSSSCDIITSTSAFLTTTTTRSSSFCRNYPHYYRDDEASSMIKRTPSSFQLHAIPEYEATARQLADYAPAATSLFNNMKLPASVVTAGMVSLGFATSFPKLPKDTLERVYSKETRAQCASLERLHIVVALISVTSELVVVLWSAVEVNQLTEKEYAPAYSVWDLIQRDADLGWSAVNSHFVLGIIGFVTMLWLRAYVMLLAVKASRALKAGASAGTAAALCLLISIVNRGVQSGGGQGIGYGKSILDLLVHYVSLLFQVATNMDSPGPLQFSAILLELTSLAFMLNVLITESDTSKPPIMEDGDSCPVIDLEEEVLDMASLSAKEKEKLETCMILREEEAQAKLQKVNNDEEEDEDEEEKEDSGSSGVFI